MVGPRTMLGTRTILQYAIHLILLSQVETAEICVDRTVVGPPLYCARQPPSGAQQANT